MKTPKTTIRKTASEECGVWLDTVQLKEKTKPKHFPRPIIKLLNPSAEGNGYSVAVALNFTQTKMKIPKTKQSSISSFFNSHRRVLNKMSSSEAPNLLQSASSSSSPRSTEMAFPRKQEDDVHLMESNLIDSETREGYDWKSENELTGAEATLWQKQDKNFSPSLSLHYEYGEETDECKSPQKKKRPTENFMRNDTQLPPQAWSHDPENSQSSQKSNSLQKFSCYEPCFLDSLQSEEIFRNEIDAKRCTSTQKCTEMPSSTNVDEEKENSNLSFNSNSKLFSLSNSKFLSDTKWAEPKNTLPQKGNSQLWGMAESHKCLDTESTKLSISSFKKPLKRNREADDENLANLFTQDSEGFRVIAHRGLQTRSPVKYHSHNTAITRSFYENMEEDEDEMLFTQDSQGHTVIKH